MNIFSYCLYIALNCAAIYFAFTNLHIYPLKKSGKATLFLFLLLGTMLFAWRFGQSMTPFVLIGAMSIIALGSRGNAARNVSLSLIGYLVYVVVDYLISVSVEAAGFSASAIAKAYPFAPVLVSGSLMFVITFFAGKYLRKHRSVLAPVFTPGVSALFLLELLICTAVYVCNIVFGAKYDYSREIVFLNGFLFFCFFAATMTVLWFAVRLIRKNDRLRAQQRAAEQLREYTDRLEKINQEMRVFRHNYMNILSTVNGYIINDDMPSLRSYYETQIFPRSQALSENEMLISRLGRLEIPELKGIVYEKLSKAMNLGLEITLEVQDVIDEAAMDILDLATVIGSYLDNALEAAEGSRKRMLTAAFIKFPDRLQILIENSTDTEVNPAKLGHVEYTTKKEHAGLGLYSAEKILGSYPNIVHKMGCEDGTFRQSLEIFKRE